MNALASIANGLMAQAQPLTEGGEWIANVFFYVMAAVAIVAALKLVTTANVVHAALYLLVVLSAVAGTYIVLGAEFAAVTQVLVYLGAIMVLLLFGVMLTRAKLGADEDLDHPQRWIAALVAIAMAAVMGYSTWEAFGDEKLVDHAPQNTQQVADEIFSTYIVPFEALSVLLLAALIGAVVVARRD
jgi:NADH-quinone oxidoreductase subunit J